MKTLFIKEGFGIRTITKSYEFFNRPNGLFASKHFEKAFNIIKDIAHSQLSNNDKYEIGQIFFDDIGPLSQLFFWAVKNLQKEKIINDNLIIIINPHHTRADDGTSEKFNETNLNRMMEMAHIIYKVPFAYKVQKLCEFEVIEEHYDCVEVLTLSEKIVFDENTETFEIAL